jgi:hypothetical protein
LSSGGRRHHRHRGLDLVDGRVDGLERRDADDRDDRDAPDDRHDRE